MVKENENLLDVNENTKEQTEVEKVEVMSKESSLNAKKFDRRTKRKTNQNIRKKVTVRAKEEIKDKRRGMKSEKIDKVLLSKHASELLSKLDSIEKARNAIQEGLKVRVESNISMLKGMLNAFEKATESQFTIRPKRLKKSVSNLISKATTLVPTVGAKRSALFAIDDYFKNARAELASLQDGSLLSDIRLLTAKLDELESKRMEISAMVEERFRVRLGLAKKVLEEIVSKGDSISNDNAEVVYKHLSRLMQLGGKLKLEEFEVKKSSLKEIDDFMKKASREFEKIESIFEQGK